MARPRRPTRSEWDAAVAAGFRPDGATWAPDSILGVRVGSSDASFAHALLPANLHDYRYWTRSLERFDADREFLDGLQRALRAHLYGWRLRLGLLIARRYWLEVRTRGKAFYWRD